MIIIEEYLRISQLLANYIHYKFPDAFKTRLVSIEVVKFGFWKWSYNIFVNGGRVKKGLI